MKNNRLNSTGAYFWAATIFLAFILIPFLLIPTNPSRPDPLDKTTLMLDSLNAKLSADNERTRQQIARNDTIIAEMEAQNAQMRELLKTLDK